MSPDWLSTGTWVLAQRDATGAAPATPAEGAGGGGGGAAPSGGGGLGLMLPMIIVLVVMIVFTSMAGKKQRKKQAAMLSSMARHDRVQTVGGIIGTIVEIKDHEVVLQVDDVSKSRIRFVKSAVQQVLKKSKEDGVEEMPAEVKPEAMARV